MGYRVAAILAGILVLVASERWFSLSWYEASGLCLVVYFCARYVGYFISERRAMKSAVDEAIKTSRER
ncbi:hypothetical protein QCM80_22925 [Bradyrhizobium sp. SSUT112]|uniref:hypothetical protein n=1 Tax=Bradyrhizobium sp. SSUT112 TaxID=3040604 RepID=UPI00244CC131|nr:hypothetical protein [Bradyrhizobium sp. SSUT112]MDH2353491.1 hypothetical protein [Bradyrhizobium sp. SSUT112]